MALYALESDDISQIPRTTFSQQKLKELEHLQALLKRKPEIISPDTMIVAEEFSDWEDSRRRIDLLGLDRDAKLVVIELKRTEDGGFMDLQAIRYASMISTMTFDKLTSIYGRYLDITKDDARFELLKFLECDESDLVELDGDVRIVLASADFSRELTTSVLWLNDCGLDIRCVCGPMTMMVRFFLTFSTSFRCLRLPTTRSAYGKRSKASVLPEPAGTTVDLMSQLAANSTRTKTSAG